MKTKEEKDYIHLEGKNSLLIISTRHLVPTILYYGAKLKCSIDCQNLEDLHYRQETPCAPVNELPISLSPFTGSGFSAGPGIEVYDGNLAWSVNCKIRNISQEDPQQLSIESYDDIRKIKVVHYLRIADEDVIQAKTKIFNESENQLVINSCLAPTFTLPQYIQQFLSFEGKWAGEFQTQRQDLFTGAFVRENRRGRTSHDNFPGLLLADKGTTQNFGDCFGFHLGWSGNHKLRLELLTDGRRYIQMGELLSPGEVTLAKDEFYETPLLYASYSAKGFNELSHQFHSFVRSQILSPPQQRKPRPVHFNTWEAVYFDHEISIMQDLAIRAAKLGAERFVLDDGWFRGRVTDRSGLGDWQVDHLRYPDGLNPLIQTVNENNMEFGLWVEPEMVNPDSDLFRTHPDWVLNNQGSEQMNFRNQYVLDLTREEVLDYIFINLDSLLKEYPQITYLKWDMNREINHSGNYRNQPSVHQYVLNLYELLAKIKKRHPQIEIESCSSGGGRADYGILSLCDRIWPSDSNDPYDRLSIQTGFSYFFPPEVMGSHVGPSPCHITGRKFDIQTRTSVALFGHLGLELDPRDLSDSEETQLSQATYLYRELRSFIHSAKYYRLETEKDVVAFCLINENKSKAILSYNFMENKKYTRPTCLRLLNLDPLKRYSFNLINSFGINETSPSNLEELNSKTFTGEILIKHGIQMPLLRPNSNLTFLIECQE